MQGAGAMTERYAAKQAQENGCALILQHGKIEPLSGALVSEVLADRKPIAQATLR
jgi:hypothetical protein